MGYSCVGCGGVASGWGEPWKHVDWDGATDDRWPTVGAAVVRPDNVVAWCASAESGDSPVTNLAALLEELCML